MLFYFSPSQFNLFYTVSAVAVYLPCLLSSVLTLRNFIIDSRHVHVYNDIKFLSQHEIPIPFPNSREPRVLDFIALSDSRPPSHSFRASPGTTLSAECRLTSTPKFVVSA